MTWVMSAWMMLLLVLGPSGSLVKSQAIGSSHDCTSRVDPGDACRQQALRWYYNTVTGRCEAFFYGGCGGNDNRYIVQGLCERYCMRPSNSSYSESAVTDDRRDCKSAFDEGPCGEPNPRWYFNVTSGRCEPFNFGGCLGNDNRYVTKKLCESSCLNSSGQANSNNATVNAQIDCTSGPIRGQCDGYFPRWSFNANTGVCEKFTYGGCGGNFNRYLTQQQCESTCKPTVDYSEEDCESKPDQGPCNQNFSRWYFNETSGRCEAFNWGGCHGNANNYPSLTKCEIACTRFLGEPTNPNRDCTSHVDEGAPCKGLIPRYYYNVRSGRCEGFIYGGCLGNDNRYVTIELCQSSCMRSTNQSHSESETSNVEKDCTSDSLYGSCDGRYLRWFFNTKSGKCERFVYGGCGGNFNRFISKEQCKGSCYP